MCPFHVTSDLFMSECSSIKKNVSLFDFPVVRNRHKSREFAVTCIGWSLLLSWFLLNIVFHLTYYPNKSGECNCFHSVRAGQLCGSGKEQFNYCLRFSHLTLMCVRVDLYSDLILIFQFCLLWCGSHEYTIHTQLLWHLISAFGTMKLACHQIGSSRQFWIINVNKRWHMHI